MPDAHYADPRLAVLYDPLDPGRSDLDVYAALVDELGARTVLDIGCGTGTFACLLAERGIDVVGLDPAAASIDVARGKPYAERAAWVVGDVTALPPVAVDLVTMTGNVAQVFVSDDEWDATLRAARAALVRGGRMVFETRDPARRAWERWTREHTYVEADVAGVGRVAAWAETTEARGELVSFTWTYVVGDEVLTSDSTLRFRDRATLTASLDRAGFDVAEVRDAPDRPGLEWVFVAVAE